MWPARRIGVPVPGRPYVAANRHITIVLLREAPVLPPPEICTNPAGLHPIVTRLNRRRGSLNDRSRHFDGAFMGARQAPPYTLAFIRRFTPYPTGGTDE